MPNRAERRAQAKNNRRGVPQQYDQTHGRARSGMLDEYQLQESPADCKTVPMDLGSRPAAPSKKPKAC